MSVGLLILAFGIHLLCFSYAPTSHDTFTNICVLMIPLQKKLEDIDKIEGASGVTKMQSMVRKVSNARRISKGLMSKGSK